MLEARPFPGGRVRTIHTSFSDGLYAEAGAVRISSAHQTVLQLVREHGLPLVPFASANGSALVSANGVTVRAPQTSRRCPRPLS